MSRFGAAMLLLMVLPASAQSTQHPVRLRCHCVSSLESGTVPCKIPNTKNMDWTQAQRLASRHHLPIQFAARKDASKVLEVDTPLPTEALLRMSDDISYTTFDVRLSEPGTDRIVCRSDKTDSGDRLREAEDAGNGYDLFVLQVFVVLMLLVVVYEAGDTILTRIRWKFSEDSAATTSADSEEKEPLLAQSDSELSSS